MSLHEVEIDDEHCCGNHFWILALICWVFMFFAAISSALALGLLSFSQVDLEVLVKAGQPHIQKNAAKIMSIVKNEHLVLCTLLMAKSLALEGVSVLMEKMFPEWVAVLLATALISIIAEVIPQALNSRYGLRFGATMSPFVRVLLLLFFPFAYPVSKLLDCLLGKGHTALLGREELKTLVNLHANEAGKGGELTLHETTIIAGALDLTMKTAKDAMTPLSETFSLDINSKLDMHTMGMIMSKGHSRIPIYSGKQTNIIGLILVKNLMFCRPEDETPIKFMTIRRVPRVGENWPLYDILNQFKKGQSHMAVVLRSKENIRTAASNTEGFGPFLPHDYISISTEASTWQSEGSEYYSATLKNAMLQESKDSDPLHRSKQHDTSISLENMESLLGEEEVVGIITLEDVMEELLQEDILDETDQYIDVHQNITIKLQHPRRGSRGSSKRASTSHQQRRSLDASRIRFSTPTTISPNFPSN
uniref:Cystathionine beta synthase n=1 Tax=Medicago truncatula TaxID=3880 RepID=A0A0C4ZLY6_MEDTR|nr:cystathionine beta synthase [Medicago truncatula]